MSMQKANAAVARGAMLLDEHKPGWERKITKPVRVSSVFLCPLGQVYGNFHAGINSLRTACPAHHYGFNAGPGRGLLFWKDDPSFRELDMAWNHLLTRRAIERSRRLLERTRGIVENPEGTPASQNSA